jgi:hypothetical protein
MGNKSAYFALSNRYLNIVAWNSATRKNYVLLPCREIVDAGSDVVNRKGRYSHPFKG